jgi:omega-6 fatty acid desaturase (delta-12 desaturase)
VAYTWLQHTDHDIPHYDADDWSWLKGAFQTVDRPYGPVVDLLHHRIGSTHVAHHIDHKIPHYRADEATAAIAAAFPEWYRHDPTPVPRALWRVAGDCLAVEERPDGWYYTAD